MNEIDKRMIQNQQTTANNLQPLLSGLTKGDSFSVEILAKRMALLI
jgi:hypothetical protein